MNAAMKKLVIALAAGLFTSASFAASSEATDPSSAHFQAAYEINVSQNKGGGNFEHLAAYNFSSVDFVTAQMTDMREIRYRAEAHGKDVKWDSLLVGEGASVTPFGRSGDAVIVHVRVKRRTLDFMKNATFNGVELDNPQLEVLDADQPLSLHLGETVSYVQGNYKVDVKLVQLTPLKRD
jgi:hypothetical protein